MFTCNTWDSSDINPKGEARGSYIWTVECITRKHWWEVVWLTCTTAGIKCLWFLPLPCSLFYQTGTLCWATSGSGSLILLDEGSTARSWMRDPLPYPSKQAVDHFMFFMRLYHVLFSHLECSVEQVLTADLSASTVCAGRLLIATSTVKCLFFSNSETWSFSLCSLASSSALSMLLALFHSRHVSWLPNWCVGRYVCPVALNCRKCCICCECTCMTSQVMKHATCTLLVWDGFDTCRFLA